MKKVRTADKTVSEATMIELGFNAVKELGTNRILEWRKYLGPTLCIRFQKLPTPMQFWNCTSELLSKRGKHLLQIEIRNLLGIDES